MHCGSKLWILLKAGGVLCEVRNEYHVDLVVSKVLNVTRTSCTVITP